MKRPLSPSSSSSHTRVCVGVIVGVHGIQGTLKLKSYTEVPEDILSYPLTDITGTRSFKLHYERENKGLFYVKIQGVKDRTAAEALKGLELYTTKDQFEGLGTDEYYHSDLIDMNVYTLEDVYIGKVSAVHNYGAGDFLEIIHPETGDLYTISFTKEAVPEVGLEKIIINKDFLLATQKQGS